MTGRREFLGVFDGVELRGAGPEAANPDDRRVLFDGQLLRVATDVGGSKPVFYASDVRTGALVFG